MRYAAINCCDWQSEKKFYNLVHQRFFIFKVNAFEQVTELHPLRGDLGSKLCDLISSSSKVYQINLQENEPIKQVAAVFSTHKLIG